MKRIIAVASGKGGVGKSTVAANLAVAFANRSIGGMPPQKVALIDVDFYGPSIPTLMGAKLDGTELKVDHQEKFIPPLKHGVKYISIAFFLKRNDDPIIWRGPMFGKAITQLFQDVSWGEVDLAFVDLPPGTGDAQLSLAQGVKLDGVVLVTTPQEVALSDVRRALNMFRKVNVPILGVVENMSGFKLPSGEQLDIFGKGGGRSLAQQYGVPFLGELALDMSIREGGDRGEPAALNGDSTPSKAIDAIGEKMLIELNREVAAPVQLVG